MTVNKAWFGIGSLAGLCLLLIAQTAVARGLPDFTKLAEDNGPAVVNISTTQTLRSSRGLPPGLEIPDFPEGSPWGELFRHFFGEGDGEREFDTRSLGSGFVIDKSGYIITNNHVVEGADEIVVRLSDRRELVAELVGSDKRSDIALLKVDATDLPLAKMGTAKDLKVGEWVMAIGSPFGFDHSVSVGVVSALGRSLPSESYVPFIQTDVAINPGNSGGPLFNLDGEVVGINSQIYSRTGGYMGLSFAIPIDVALDVVAQLKDKGYVTRGWLGVLIQDVTRELAESFGMKKPIGALISKVLDGSPAAKAGLKVGDIILEFEGEEIVSSSDLPPLVGRTRVGTRATVKVLREGEIKVLNVTIAELPAEEELQQRPTAAPGTATDDRLGLAVSELSEEQRKELDIGNNGVLVTDVADGPAAKAGIRPGDVIVKIDNVDITDAARFREITKELRAGKSVPVLVQRRGSPIFLPLKVPEK